MSDNPFNIDDPKLTAFVLGEMDEAERAEFQEQLDANGGLKSAVDELREFTDLLGNSLTGEAAPTLTREQRQQIRSAAQSGASTPDAQTLAADAESEQPVAAADRPATETVVVARQRSSESRGTWVAGLVAAALLIGLGCWALLSAVPQTEELDVAFVPDQKTMATPLHSASKLGDAKTSQILDEYSTVAASLAANDDRAAADGRIELSKALATESFKNPESESLQAASQLEGRSGGELGGRGVAAPGGPSEAGFSGKAGGYAPGRDEFARPPANRASGLLPHPTAPSPTSASDPSGRARSNRPKDALALDAFGLKLASPSKPTSRTKAEPEPAPAPAPAPARALRPGQSQQSAPADGKPASPFSEAPAIEAESVLERKEKVATKQPEEGGESYQQIIENPFVIPNSVETSRSTFSIDVDTGSYSNVRRFLTNNQLPPTNAVRVEEMINYFHYDYPNPEDGRPFSVNIEAGTCPWNAEHQLVRIGLKGREIPKEDRPPSNLVFLIDTSGSMRDPLKLPLVQTALGLLVDNMTEDDRIAIVTYSGKAGLMLQSTSGEHRESIRAAISQLQASGSTNGGEGIQMAYRTAIGNFYEGGTNRVILCTDGDFNVGIDDHNELIKLIEEKRKSNVFLSVCGFGAGNLKEKKLEQIANKGNGTYSYIDSKREADKVFVKEMTGTLYTIAKDVKIQVDFNPSKVGAYRLVGYENRRLENRDFNDDTKDAGEIGAGHRVTALYEIVPPKAVAKLKAATEDVADPPKYFKKQEGKVVDSNELLTVRLRFKQPDGDQSALIEQPLVDVKKLGMTSSEFDWAVSVAAFGLLLRDSQYKGQASFDLITELAAGAKGKDESGRRQEFIDLVARARKLLGK